MTDASLARTAARGTRFEKQVVRGLLWRQWVAYGNVLLGVLSAYLVLGWVLLVFYHPGWILGGGAILALFLGVALGGGDAAEGAEEFSFALPPTRAERYLTRLAFGGAILAAFLLVGLLSVALDLPQLVWSVFVNSGLTDPFPPCRPRFVYALAVAIPLAAYAISFTLAANTARSNTAVLSGLCGAAGAAAVMGVGFYLEDLLWTELTGFVSTPLLLATAPLALQAGYFAYRRKEGVNRPATIAGGRWWVWIIVIVVVLFLLFVLSASPSRRVPTKSRPVRRTERRAISDRPSPPSAKAVITPRPAGRGPPPSEADEAVTGKEE